MKIESFNTVALSHHTVPCQDGPQAQLHVGLNALSMSVNGSVFMTIIQQKLFGNLWDMWNLFFLKCISLGIRSPCERMILVSSRPRNEKYLGSMKPFSEGEPESLGFPF